jgi:hypothetical protein
MHGSNSLATTVFTCTDIAMFIYILSLLAHHSYQLRLANYMDISYQYFIRTQISLRVGAATEGGPPVPQKPSPRKFVAD